MAKSPDAFRTIGEVADWLDVPTHVLRFWESRFTQIKPVKRAGGRRYYRPADMELLGGIKRLLHNDGLTIRGVQKLLREEGVRHVAGLSPGLDTDPAARTDANGAGDADPGPVGMPDATAHSGRGSNVEAEVPPGPADAPPPTEGDAPTDRRAPGGAAGTVPPGTADAADGADAAEDGAADAPPPDETAPMPGAAGAAVDPAPDDGAIPPRPAAPLAGPDGAARAADPGDDAPSPGSPEQAAAPRDPDAVAAGADRRVPLLLARLLSLPTASPGQAEALVPALDRARKLRRAMDPEDG